MAEAPAPVHEGTRLGAPALGECHLWHVPVRARPDWLALLDQRERASAARFTRAPARDVFLTSRAAQRLVGAHYLGVPPGAVAVRRDCAHCATEPPVPHGRPRFAHGTPPPVDYSVSHTEEHLLIAVTGHGVIGVDIEARGSFRDADVFPRAVLTPAEWEHFTALPAHERPDWLLTAWTRKEAAMKLTGLGLRADPRQLDVRGPQVTAGPIPGWPDTPVHLYALPAPEAHTAALASTVPITGIRIRTLPEPRTSADPS